MAFAVLCHYLSNHNEVPQPILSILGSMTGSLSAKSIPISRDIDISELNKELCFLLMDLEAEGTD